MVYAKGTGVPVEKSRLEIERIITAHGATEFSYAIRGDKAMIQFEVKQRMIRFILPLPQLKEFKWYKKRGQNEGNESLDSPELK